MDYNFTEKEHKSFRNAFTLFDKDHDGKLSSKEVDDVLRFLGKDPADYQMEFVAKDLDMYEQWRIVETKQLSITKLMN